MSARGGRPRASRLQATRQPRGGTGLDDRQCRAFRDVVIHIERTPLPSTPFRKAARPAHQRPPAFALRGGSRTGESSVPPPISSHRPRVLKAFVVPIISSRVISPKSSPGLDHPSVAACAQPRCYLCATYRHALTAWRIRFVCFAKNCGAGARARTADLLITNQLLYQLSYAGTGKT